MLSALRRAGTPYQLSPKQLLQQTLVSSGTMTNRIDRLVERGLVTRQTDPNDGRGILVEMSPAGPHARRRRDHAARRRRGRAARRPAAPPSRSGSPGCCASSASASTESLSSPSPPPTFPRPATRRVLHRARTYVRNSVGLGHAHRDRRAPADGRRCRDSSPYAIAQGGMAGLIDAAVQTRRLEAMQAAMRVDVINLDRRLRDRAAQTRSRRHRCRRRAGASWPAAR